MEWQPQPQGLAVLLHLLRDASKPNNSDQALIQRRLLSFNETPDYNCYLVHILVCMTEEDSYTRAIAGLTLKNNILSEFNSLHLSVLAYIKDLVLSSLDKPDLDWDVRKAIDSVITAIVVRGQILNWPSAIDTLVNKLESPDPLAVEMSLDSLQKICEDNANEMEQATVDGNTPILECILPKLFPFFSHSTPRIQISALSTANHFIQLKSPSFVKHIQSYLKELFAIASLDMDSLVCKEVCHSFVMLLEHFTQQLLPYIGQLTQYMIHCNQSESTQVALEACDFWFQFSRLERYQEQLVPLLPDIIPVILKSLVYTDEDILALGRDEESDSKVHPQVNRPRHKQLYYKYALAHANHDDDEEDDEDEDVEDDEFFSEWTLRKFSATSLEALTSTFRSHVTNVLLPLLNHTLFSQDWKVVESSILALGAVAEGGIDGISPNLPQLIPYLVTNLSNSNAHVRGITCWTISRFSAWIVSQCGNSEGRTQFYEPVLRELLSRVLDGSRRVQEAACSAFSTLEEKATDQELVPYLPVILNHLTRAFRLYRHRSLRLLYDTIGTLAESVGPALNQPGCIAVLMPPLIARWNGLANDDADLFPLLACLTDITTALGIGFLPFTEPVFTRCVMLVSTTLQTSLSDNDLSDLELDDEFIVVPLDLISGIVQGLGHAVQPFVQKSSLLGLLAVCAHHDTRSDVLQPTYALIGDLAVACFDTLAPYLEKIMPELIRQMNNDDPAYKSARNNAIWALGEISLRWNPESMEPYIDTILHALIRLILTAAPSVSIYENAVITVGRLGIHFTQAVAKHLAHFSHAWLYRARQLRENEERDSAFRGFCKTSIANPQAHNDITICLLFDMIGHWKEPSPELSILGDKVIQVYRNLLNDEQWQHVSPYLSRSS